MQVFVLREAAAEQRHLQHTQSLGRKGKPYIEMAPGMNRQTGQCSPTNAAHTIRYCWRTSGRLLSSAGVPW